MRNLGALLMLEAVFALDVPASIDRPAVRANWLEIDRGAPLTGGLRRIWLEVRRG